MISPNLLEIERCIRRLSVEEQQWLLERINQQVQERTGTGDKFFNVSYINEQIKAMAEDPDIQAEIAAINEEFAVTEIDSLDD